MGTCKLCEKLGELQEKQLIGEFVLPAGRGSVQRAHNRYGKVPAGDMKLDSLKRLSERTITERSKDVLSQKASRRMKAIPPPLEPVRGNDRST